MPRPAPSPRKPAPADGRVAGGAGRAAALAALLAVVVYANSLQNGLVYDDGVAISLNGAAHDPLDWRTILLTRSWFALGHPTVGHRPFTTWTFALNHAVHGLDPLGYHVVNVLLHAAASALVAMLAVSLGLRAVTAGLAAALFAVHPIHTEAVANVVGRAELLAGGFSLLALLAERRAEVGRSLLASAGVVAAYGAALLAKESAATLLVVVPLVDLLGADGGSMRLFLARLPGRRLAVYAALVAVTGGYLLVRQAVFGTALAPADTIAFWMNPAASAPTALRLLTALGMQARALWLLVVPVALSADYSFRELTVASGVGDPGVVAGAVSAAALTALVLVLWRRSPVACFWLLFAIVAYGTASNVLFPSAIFAERQLYLPSVGFCALVAMALARAHAAGLRRTAAATAGVVVVLFGLRTVARNPVWQSDLSLCEATVIDVPESVQAHRMLGTTYSGLGRDDEALREFARAVSIYPEETASLYNAGIVLQRRGQHVEAVSMFRRVTEIDPRFYPAWINQASTYNAVGNFLPALAAADEAIRVKPDLANAYVVKGGALRGLRRLDESQAAFAEAVRLAPDLPDALFGLGVASLERGDFTAAASAFERLVQIAPVVDGYRGLVHSYRQTGRTADAERAVAAARARFPTDPFFAPGG